MAARLVEFYAKRFASWRLWKVPITFSVSVVVKLCVPSGRPLRARTPYLKGDTPYILHISEISVIAPVTFEQSMVIEPDSNHIELA